MEHRVQSKPCTTVVGTVVCWNKTVCLKFYILWNHLDILPGNVLCQFHRVAFQGRGGKGSIYVWAAGNGGMYDDMCGADGYVSSPESISVQSLTDKGDVPFFGEKCTSTMISVPTGGEHTKEEELGAKYKIKVVSVLLVSTPRRLYLNWSIMSMWKVSRKKLDRPCKYYMYMNMRNA